MNEKLFKAVETGKVDEVKKALTEEKINAASYYGAKAMVLAVKQDDVEILKMLLKNGEKISRESFWRRIAHSALLSAVEADRTETVKLLLEYGAGADKKTLHSQPLLNAINEENIAMKTLFMDHGVDISKRIVVINKDVCDKAGKSKLVYEDGFYIPETGTKDNTFIQYAKEGKCGKIEVLLKEGGISAKVIMTAIDEALKNNKPKTVKVLTDYSNNSETGIYLDCLKEHFLRASKANDTEKVKFYLEKLIESVVGVLTDETGKSTLKIALENNPADIIKILSNFGFDKKHFAKYI